MNLNQSQQSAVEYLDGPLLVLAGPGTGKTQLLSAKVAHILKTTDANPDNILCLTFTEPATANMRQRLLSIVGPAASQINIHTYHAFGADILSQYKNYAETFSRVLDNPASPVLQHKIIKQIVEQLPAMDILRSANIADISDTIKSVKSARLTADDLAKIAAQNLLLSAELSSEITPVFLQLKPRMKYDDIITQIYQPALEIFAKYSSDQPIVKNIEPEANTWLRELSKLIDQENAKEKPSVSPLNAWLKKNFERDEAGNYRPKNYIANKKLASLAGILKAYDQALAADGLYDFADMIEEAIKALKNDRGFRLSLSERYQYILLDEFQDTNQSQFELVKLLTDYEKPLIMAVGDDDQAIFAFQGANVSNMLDFADYYQAKIITLTENYRSTQEILDFSHQIADQIESSFAKHHNIDKILTAKRDQAIRQNDSSTHLYRHEFLTADAEYSWVAEQIHQLVKQGEALHNIAIITPKHKFIAPLLPYLKSYKDLKIAYEKRDNVLEDHRIHQLLILARFIYGLANGLPASHYLPEILHFPFWQISPLLIIEIIQTAREDKKSALEYLSKSDQPELQRIAQFFANLTAVSFDTPLELFFDYLIGTAPLQDFRSPFLEFYTQDQDADYTTYTLYENLFVLRETLRDYLRQPNPKLADLIAFLEDYTNAGQTITNTSPYQDSASAIQILTAHKSKGLEFKHVFLVATDDLAWGNAKGNDNRLALPKNLTHIRHTGATEDEKLRLFFVALTRAEKSITMTNSLKNYLAQSPGRLQYLKEYTEGDQLFSPLLPSPQITTHYEELDPAKIKTDLRKSWLASYKSPAPEIRDLLLSRLENYHLTASDLTSFIDIIYSGPMALYRNKVLRAPSEPASPKIVLGNLIHATFEQITNQKITDEEAFEFFNQKLTEVSLLPEEIDFVREKGLASLAASIKKFGTLLRAPDARAEVNLYHENLTINDIPITGKIDHIQIDHANKTIEIYDFKTSKYDEKNWDSSATLFKYALQLEFYQMLLSASPTFNKYQISRAHILFVIPDADGRVYDKAIDLDHRNLAHKLTPIVYQQIKTLAFLDQPELSLEPDPTRNFKDIKSFIELVLAEN